MNQIEVLVVNKLIADIEGDKSFDETIKSQTVKEYFINLVTGSRVSLVSPLHIDLRFKYDRDIIPTRSITWGQERRAQDQFAKFIVEEGLDKVTIPGNWTESKNDVEYELKKVDMCGDEMCVQYRAIPKEEKNMSINDNFQNPVWSAPNQLIMNYAVVHT